MTSSPTVAYPAPTPSGRLRSMLGVIIAGAVLVAGASRWLLAPEDPAGCVSVLTCQHGWLIIVECAFLALVLAGLVRWISGAGLEEMGVFGVAIGLSLAAMRYENASYLWMFTGQGSEPLQKQLALDMTLESVGWWIVVFAAVIGSRLAVRAFSLKPAVVVDSSEEYRRGGLTVLFMSMIAFLLLQILSAGTELAPIQTGQVYFACAVSFYVASLCAYQLTSAHSSMWAYLAVGVVAIAGYVWTWFNPTPVFPGRTIAHWAHFSPTAFGRALPIQVIMVGTASAIFGNWHQRQFTQYATSKDKQED